MEKPSPGQQQAAKVVALECYQQLKNVRREKFVHEVLRIASSSKQEPVGAVCGMPSFVRGGCMFTASLSSS
jgi:hypothetical protein